MVIILRHAKPSNKFGKDPHQRGIQELLENSIINVDKPAGPSSHQVSAYVKQILKVSKSGHAGTLDPKVTGVLPVALGRGTRIVQALLPSGKTYVCLMRLHKSVPESRVQEAFQAYTGNIRQLPPVKSAVKRQWRERKVYDLRLIEFSDQDILFLSDVEAGTYIRKLCHDMGETLGCGAHMVELRRIRAGPFDESTLVTLQDITDAFHVYHDQQQEGQLRLILRPIEDAIVLLKKIWVLDSTVDSLCHGATLKIPGIGSIDDDIPYDTMVAVLTLKGELIGLGKSRMSSLDMQKYSSGVAAKLDQVFMQPGVYPKADKV